MNHLKKTVLSLILCILTVMSLFSGCGNVARKGDDAESLLLQAEDAMQDSCSVSARLKLYSQDIEQSYTFDGIMDNRGEGLCFSLQGAQSDGDQTEGFVKVIRLADGSLFLNTSSDGRYSCFHPKDSELLSVETGFLRSLPWTIRDNTDVYELEYVVPSEDNQIVFKRLQTLGESLNAVGLSDLTGVRFAITLEKETCRPVQFSVTWPESSNDSDLSDPSAMLNSIAMTTAFSDYGCASNIAAPTSFENQSFTEFQKTWILTAYQTMRHRWMSYIFPSEIVQRVIDTIDKGVVR